MDNHATENRIQIHFIKGYWYLISRHKWIFKETLQLILHKIEIFPIALCIFVA